LVVKTDWGVVLMRKFYNKIKNRKTELTQSEVTDIKNRAGMADKLLNSSEFKYFIDYLKEGLKSIEKQILENTITDVSEEVTFSESLKKKFFTPKKVQIDELSGAYKQIKKVLKDLQLFVEQGKELKEKIESEQVEVVDEKRS
jgi:hypothetical protein